MATPGSTMPGLTAPKPAFAPQKFWTPKAIAGAGVTLGLATPLIAGFKTSRAYGHGPVRAAVAGAGTASLTGVALQTGNAVGGLIGGGKGAVLGMGGAALAAAGVMRRRWKNAQLARQQRLR